MKIMITGGHGFLGHHVSEEFSKRGYKFYDGYAGVYCYDHPWHTDAEIWRPHSSDFNLMDRTSTMMGVGTFKPDVILHMAAVCGGILANKNSPADFLHKNLDMASNLFHAAKEYKCDVYTLGSVCSYPKYCPVPFNEDDLWNGYPEETNAPYGVAKRVQLLLQQTYRQQYDVKGAHLIPVNLYGEHDHFDLTNSHVIPALIRKFDNAIEKHLPFVECWGTGEATREFLYAGDAAEAIVKAVLLGIDTEQPINLGTGQDISIKDLAHLIGELSGFKGEIVFNGAVSDGQPKRMLDVGRAKGILKWTAKTSFKEGLLKTIQWYRDNREQIIAADVS